MSLRLVPTPLDAPVELPAIRGGAFDPALFEAVVPDAGSEAPVARLREPGALVVTTGQQPALFTGPLYTVYKALSAAALARVLERRWRRPVVPVFWVAGDDHDFAEASRAAWLSGDGAVVTGELPPRPPDAPLTPMYRERLGSGVEAVLEALARDLPTSEFKDFTLDWLRRYFRPEATVAASFAGALAALLAPAGIVCLRSTDRALKRAAAPLMLRALRSSHELARDLAARAAELEAAGRPAGVAPGDGATVVMLEGALGRDRLVMEDGAFVTRRSRERFTLAELERIADTEPERLSPNVLLRPVIESALLPTVAYLAGPAELRYLELASPVYERLRVDRQLPVPRWSGILVEPRVDRVLDKFGIALEELLEPPGPLETRLVRSQLPGEAAGALASLRAAIESHYAALVRSAVEIDPTLEKPVEGARRHALAGAQDIEKKLVHHLKRRQETELGQIARARASVLPNGKPQERVLTVAPFLARYGPGLVTLLVEEMERWYAGALEK